MPGGKRSQRTEERGRGGWGVDPTEETHSDVEEGVGREALREGRGVTVLDWGSDMNCSRAMDLRGENRTGAKIYINQDRHEGGGHLRSKQNQPIIHRGHMYLLY